MSSLQAATLYYVADPMCAWCWGFRAAFEGVEARLHEGVRVRLVMGGLAPDSAQPMDEGTRGYVQSAWHAVASRSGASFNHDFWELCAPRRSTWPACRAVLAAEALQPGAGRRMFAGIQRAYYTEARNPSDVQTLAAIALEVGVREQDFVARIDAPEARQALERDLELRDSFGISGYPSVALEQDGQLSVLTRGYISRAEFQAIASERGLLAELPR